MRPVLARTRIGLAAARAALPSPVVLVPTMGALHDGHRSLLRRAREVAGGDGSVVVSVFVNPLQFGAGEDLDRYPRALEEDLRLCAQEEVAVVFAPSPEQMYPREQMVTVSAGAMGGLLEGRSRPGFFDGVLTVVLKLLQMIRPDVAVFGEKDAQQLAMVRRMAADFGLPVGIEAVATVRAPDGLALSSRNSYLSAAGRATALAIPRALRAGLREAGHGPAAVRAAASAVLDAAAAADPPLRTDYLELADPVTFAGVPDDHRGPALLLVAAWVGSTRLIDNMALDLRGRYAAGHGPTPQIGGRR